jgi:hypothetical protein
MMWFAIPFLALLAFLSLFAFCMLLWERRDRIECFALWRRLRPSVRLAAVFFVLAVTFTGADKGGGGASVRRALATFLTIMSDGSLRGPTNTIANAASVAAISAVNAESASMLAIASNALQWAQTDIPLLEIDVTNTAIAWLSADMPQSLANSNLVARCDLIRTEVSTNGVITAFVAFNQTPASAPICAFEGSLDGVTWETFVASSNSFPTLYPVATPDGVVSCLEYSVSIPASMLSVAIIPQREMTFGGGGSNSPLQVLGAVMVDNQIGRDGTFAVATNEQWLFEGGLCVGVLTNGVPVP